MNWATVAAFSAAALSLANVVVSAWLARRRNLEGWRRDAERPAVAHILTLSDSCFRAWSKAWDSGNKWFASCMDDDGLYIGQGDTNAKAEAFDHLRQGSDLLEELRFEVAQLDLVAGQSVRDAAHALVGAHANTQRQVSPDELTKHAPVVTPSTSSLKKGEINQLERILVAAARADLGLDTDYEERRALRSDWWFYTRAVVRSKRQ